MERNALNAWSLCHPFSAAYQAGGSPDKPHRPLISVVRGLNEFTYLCVLMAANLSRPPRNAFQTKTDRFTQSTNIHSISRLDLPFPTGLELREPLSYAVGALHAAQYSAYTYAVAEKAESPPRPRAFLCVCVHAWQCNPSSA